LHVFETDIDNDMDFKLDNTVLLVFSDIDGTFISNDSFYAADNFNVAENLIRYGHLLIFNSSKTFYEIKKIQDKFNASHPFISETGSGIYCKNLFGSSLLNQKEGYEVMFESSKAESFKSNVRVLIKEEFYNDLDIFDDMSNYEKSRLSGLFDDDLENAMKRDFSILIKWYGDDKRFIKFQSQLKRFNLNIIKGGRFCHICGNNKGQATKFFTDKIKNLKSKKIVTIGIGDSTNDIDMLDNVNYPCIVKSPNNRNMTNLIKNRNLILSSRIAPEGWKECLNTVISNLKNQEVISG
tara:strand:+ start:685 stop:1569 length:885 start_codon:yes stop_codon:yes gene_type:complete